MLLPLFPNVYVLYNDPKLKDQPIEAVVVEVIGSSVMLMVPHTSQTLTVERNVCYT